MIKYHNFTSPFYRDKNTNSAYMSGKKELPLIRFHCFENESWMDAVMTTKKGGVSTGHLSSLNLGYDRGDDPLNVLSNHRRLAQALDLPVSSFVKGDQVHKGAVKYAGPDILPCGPDKKPFPETDGLYTDSRGVALCIGAADCMPVFLADPVTESIALVHSGWRGTVLKIAAVALQSLIQKGSNPKNIIALIGPSISMENYEVSEDVVREFSETFSDTQMPDIACKKDAKHYLLDLWAACWHTLNDGGIPPSNIHFSGICTFENHHLLFSHRYTKGKRGNQNGVMVIR